MDHKIFFTNEHHIEIFVVFFTILVDGVLCLNSNISNCAAQSCGNGPKIDYPFWIQGRQESYCGSSGFDVTCKNKNPVVKISGDDYIIENIFYENSSILLYQAELDDSGNRCPAPQHNFSIDGTPFSYGPETVDLFFFYNCTKPYDKKTFAVDCATNSSRYAFAIFHPEILDHWNYSIQSCQPPINAPVTTDSLGRLLNMSYSEVLRRGFGLQWDEEDCRNCRRSGGRCGSSFDKFICSCHDHISPKACRESRVRWKIAIGFGAAAGSALVTCFIFLYCMRRQKQKKRGSTLLSREISSDPSSVYDPETAIGNTGVHIFDYNELEQATNNFDSEQELGDGGFGTVYKGKLKDGRVVAVKRLYESNFKRVEHFINEVVILTRLRHQNLVTLYGCTSRHSRELLLVYEYVPNGTVADHLHGALAMPGSLPWSTRMRIAIETASALSYLHASDVIHRDVKTNNILLDADFHVKVADFGLSRLFPINATHISTAPQGTPGYVDPEYHECYHLTDKSDVFSFGVVLIELISSLPAVDITRHRHDINLSNMAVNKIQGNLLHELVDPNIGYESDYNVRMMITDVAELAFQSLQYGRDMRPSMQEVLETLMLIQDKDYSSGNTNGNENQADDVALLKARQLISSPNSVIEGIVSNTTTPNTSS
ncbi:OLC1v1014143C2 [Oldenlandia corymbosa var. corymbosa]|uniref:non-specific serine/threonine protein kinase n=1 Tax=Oldenlandia corymbosa var. corymbosa TaxID=529605 RepID=A0AAV1E3B9_OLDCO|nr:OLC1v1014143C2 [Oldenlandia corymbosa var. corymbosa]